MRACWTVCVSRKALGQERLEVEMDVSGGLADGGEGMLRIVWSALSFKARKDYWRKTYLLTMTGCSGVV